MIPKINKRGYSFKGIALYLMHDKQAQSSERVLWSCTGNLYTDDVEKAALVMAWTDKNAQSFKLAAGGSLSGRKVEAGGVYHYSLSWSPLENPDKEHMQEQALETLQRLGLSDHQYFMVAHGDTDHMHLHIVVNLTSVRDGRRVTPSFDKRELQSWALDYEREHGLYCEQREINAARRNSGVYIKYRDSKQDYSTYVTSCYERSDSGEAFIHALEEQGLYLGRSRRGNSYVIVDSDGDIQKLGRQLDIEEKGKAKSRAIADKLGSLDVLDGEELAADLKADKLPELEPSQSKEKEPPASLNLEFDEVSYSEIEQAFYKRSFLERSALKQRLDREYYEQEQALDSRREELGFIAMSRGLRRSWYRALGKYDKARVEYLQLQSRKRVIERLRTEEVRRFDKLQKAKLRALKESFKSGNMLRALTSRFAEQDRANNQ